MNDLPYQGLEPRVIFEDTHLIVLSKPAGLLSQGEITGDVNLVDWLRIHFQRNYVGLVHRLDRNTSGIMVVAKRTKSANRLTEALQAGKICRIYLAWIRGRIDQPVRWSHTLYKDPVKNMVRVVTPVTPGAKEAHMKSTPVSHGVWKGKPYTLVELELETGRSHQIRVQSSHEGHPLLGDAKYGGEPDFGRPALHSYRISFPHPMSGEILRFEDPLPSDMDQIQRVDLKI